MTVIVIGEALIDIVETPSGERTEHVGGSPANVAFGLARLERPVILYTRVGRDRRGDRIVAHLESAGVRIAPQSRVDAATSTARAVLDSEGGATYDFDIRWDLPALELPAATVVHTGSIALFLEPGRDEVMRAIEHAPAIVTLDPNIRASLIGDRDTAVAIFERAVASCDLVKLSDEDARWLYPALTDDEVLGLIRERGAAIAVITRGAQGARLSAGAASIDIEPVQVAVVDTIGAGDSFMASLIDSLCEYGSVNLDETQLRTMGARAAAAAAITVSRAGALLPTRQELPD